MQQSQKRLSPVENQLAAVIVDHPEYHALLQSTDEALSREFTPEGGETNPFLHMGMHLAIQEQVSTDRPLGIQKSYQKLVNRYGVSEAEHQIMECLGRSLWEAQQNNEIPDEEAYLQCIQRLV